MAELGVVSAGTTTPAEFVYPSGYEKPPVEELIGFQAEAWRISRQEKRRALETARRLSEDGENPEKSEGLFAFPYFGTIGTYGDAHLAILRKLGKRRDAHSFLANPNLRLRRDRNVDRRLGGIAKKQRSSLLVLPAQLGLCYAGMSVTEAFGNFDKKREIPLGTFEVGAILLACDRLSTIGDLFLYCPANGITIEGRLETTPYFGVDQHGKMILGHRSPRSTSPHYGAVTGFYPRMIRNKG